MNNRKPITITVRVEAAVAERLHHLARKLRRSRSSVAGEAIEVFLTAPRKGDAALLTEHDLAVEMPR